MDEPVAEKVTVRGGGCVVRLAGLYSLQRGPHSVWLDEKSVSGLLDLLLVGSVGSRRLCVSMVCRRIEPFFLRCSQVVFCRATTALVLLQPANAAVEARLAHLLHRLEPWKCSVAERSWSNVQQCYDMYLENIVCKAA